MILRGREIFPLFRLEFNPYTRAKGRSRRDSCGTPFFPAGADFGRATCERVTANS